jgi:hypothetical protein
MGPAAGDKEQMSLYDKTRSLLEKAGYQVVFPDNQDSLCCGQPFASKGYAEQAEHKRQELIEVALAHVDKDEVRSAYNRADYIERRRTMMAWWSEHIQKAATGSLSAAAINHARDLNVVPIR